MGQIGNLVVVGVLTIASGLLDARGFVYAARAWPDGQLDLKMALASLAAFGGGVSVYIIAVKFMQNAGIQGVALQSGIWFVVTAVGIAAMDGTLRAMDPHASRWSVSRSPWRSAGSSRPPARQPAEQTSIRNTMDSRLIEMLACPVSKAPVFFSRGPPAHRLPDQQARLPDQGRDSGHAARKTPSSSKTTTRC